MRLGPEPGRDRLGGPDRVAVGDQRDDVGRRLGAQLLRGRPRPGRAAAARLSPPSAAQCGSVQSTTSHSSRDGPPLEDAVALLAQRRGRPRPAGRSPARSARRSAGRGSRSLEISAPGPRAASSAAAAAAWACPRSVSGTCGGLALHQPAAFHSVCPCRTSSRVSGRAMVGGSLCGRHAGPPWRDRNLRRPRRMLVLGGARSGKSSFAEQLLARRARRRLRRLRAGARRQRPRVDRPGGPAPDPPAGVLADDRDGRPAGVLGRPGPPVLVDCLTTWLAAGDGRLRRLVGGARRRRPAGRGGRRARRRVAGTRRRVVAVSNEVGSGVVPATPSGRRFRDELGVLNARVAASSPRVWLVDRRAAAAAALTVRPSAGPPRGRSRLSTACWSIAASSSSAKSRLSSAPTFCSSWPTLLAPIRTVVTRGSRSAHASASCARLCPRCCGDLVQRADVRRAPPR